ncbi:DNA oxidative demethylase AlkB [Niveibacterium sp. SC-1]|uniref:DNA oxidative demethylase AlkB n=1 Tax=Niveibacterium sp. SC-1 TaxID=3135646 RepID=UPI00311E2770
MTPDLFDFADASRTDAETIAPGAVILHGFARETTEDVLAAVAEVVSAAPFRHMQTPGGYTMSVAMSCCGPVGWVSDTRGYRYSPIDPETGRDWPRMPELLQALAREAAAAAGFADFAPDACLINRYAPGARLSLHQDRDERDRRQPIVSVSLGLPATFLFGGLSRGVRPQRYRLVHGDVVVWGGPSRLAYHGVAPLAAGVHPQTGEVRINLTFRRAL